MPMPRRIGAAIQKRAMNLGVLALCAALIIPRTEAADVHPSDPRQVRFAIPDARSADPALLGYLRIPAGAGPFPAVVLMHGCGGEADKLDQNWGARLQGWGYVALTVDSFGPRGIKTACSGTVPPQLLDAFGAQGFLLHQPMVQAGRIALMGFSLGGISTLLDVERGGIEQRFPDKFRAAIAFYPLCAESGAFTVPTLVINGERDDWSSAEACRKMVAQQSDIGIARTWSAGAPVRLVIIPNAFHDFDRPSVQPNHRYLGHWLAFDAEGADQAAAEVQGFLSAELGP